MSFSWQGLSGRWYEFDVARTIRAWEPIGGVFMFVKPGDLPTMEAGGPICLYVEQTANLADSLASHTMWKHAAELGAKEIHLIVEPDSGKRAQMHDDLLKAQTPVLNRHALKAA